MRAGALEEQAHDAAGIDADDLDVAAIDEQARAQPIDHALDLGAQALGEFVVAIHAERIGRSGALVEHGRSGNDHRRAARFLWYRLASMQVRVLLFGSLREAAGAKELAVELPARATVIALRELLTASQPGFEALAGRLRVAVNREFAAADALLADGDEVAFLPPVSGGAGGDLQRCTISEQALDAAAVAERVVGPDAGGVVSFVGAVRDHARGRSIRHLEYEAYPEMAIAEMERICDAAAQRWPGVRIAIAHRVGRLEIGDLAVVVVAAAAHRAEAFDACRFAIDTLKETVPIWKKEVATDGEYWVDDHP